MIRVSGAGTLDAVKKLGRFKDIPRPRYAYLRNLWHPSSGDIIDKGLVLWFPGPASFTGEDSCEFQVHGGTAVIQSMLNALSTISGLQQARPGEFTKRAFYSGKLDLTEVEGLADLIHAETEFQRKQAILQANGNLSELYQKWRTTLIRCIAHQEAYIDFSEEENIEENVLEELNEKLLTLVREISSHLNDGRRGERLRQGVRAAILGAPNVGKSSFLNLICQRSISIVTNIAGTTRDIIESCYNINGYPIIFADTAGLRKNSQDVVEVEGIARARNYAKLADFVILLMDAERLDLKQIHFDLETYKEAYLRDLGFESDDLNGKNILLVINKIDLLTKDEVEKLKEQLSGVVLISCKENEGVPDAITAIKTNLEQL